MGRKRGNNEGSIYVRRDGLWVGAVSLPGGRRSTMYGRTREEVRRKLAAALSAREAGTLADARGQTVGQFLDTWLAEIVKPSVREWTYRGYEVHVRRHIKPALGKLPLNRLEPAHVQAFLNRKLQDGLSPASVRYIRGTLRTALQQGVRWGELSRNVAALVDGPRSRHYEIKPLDATEARRLLETLSNDRLRGLYTVALTMGLRQGEALGLRWQDVDFGTGSLRVEKQLRRFDGRFELVDVKTARSRRTLAMPASVAAELERHSRRQVEELRSRGTAEQSYEPDFYAA